MPDPSRYAVDHDEIRRWVERPGGRPAILGGFGRDRRTPGFRIDFPEYRIKAALKRIPWDEFFRAFDAAHWGVAYQEETDRGEVSRFYRFIKRVQSDEVRSCAERSRALGSRRRG